IGARTPKVDAGLLLELAGDGGRGGLARVDHAAGQRPHADVAPLDEQDVAVGAGSGDHHRVGGCVLTPGAQVPACHASAAGGVERPPVRVQLVGDHGVGLALVPVGDLGRGGDRVGDPALDVTGQGGRAQLWRGDVYRLVSGVVGVPGAEFGGYR